jgi:hypothetical protein
MIIPKLERFLYFYILHVPSNLAFKVTARFASVGGRPLSVLLVIKRRIHVSGLWMLERYGCPYFITTKPDSTAFIGQSVYIYTHIHTYIHTYIHTVYTYFFYWYWQHAPLHSILHALHYFIFTIPFVLSI